MSEYGIKIARSGKSVDSTDPRDFSLDSNSNMWKILKEEYVTISLVTNTPTYHTVDHNLGYKPMLIAYVQHPSSNNWSSVPCLVDSFSGGTWSLVSTYEHVDENTLRIQLYDLPFDPMPSSPTSVNIKYYILADPRTDAWYEPALSDTDSESYETDKYGLIISREGIDVKTAEPKNLVFSSDFSTLKIFRVVRFEADASRSNLNPAIVPHNLDHSPTFFCNVETSFVWTVGRGVTGVPYAWVDEINLYYGVPVVGSVILCVDSLDE